MTTTVTHATRTRTSSPFDIFRHSWILAKRSVIKTFRTPEGLIDVTLSPIMFTVLFAYIFGGAISGSTADYLPILIPGILAQNMAFASVGIGITLNTDIEKGIFDRFRSLPISRLAPLLGAVMGDLVRTGLLITIMLTTGYIMGYRIEGGWLHAVMAIVLAVIFSLSLSWASMLVGLKARTTSAVQGIVFMTLFPLTFASGAFVPTDTLPGWMKTFAENNPITHLVNAMRALFNGGDWVDPTLWTLGWCAVLIAVFAPLAMRAYAKHA